MNEKTTIEKLEIFAKNNGIRFYTSEDVRKQVLTPGVPYIATKFIIFYLDDVLKNLFFVFHVSSSFKNASHLLSLHGDNMHCNIYI